METKDSTLESAILDVWKNAAENNMSGEDSFEIGTDRYRKHTQDITPGQMEEEITELNALIEELDEAIPPWARAVGRGAKVVGKATVKHGTPIAKAAAKTAGQAAKDVAKAVKKKATKTTAVKAYQKTKAGIKKAKEVGGKIKKAAQSGTAYQSQEYDPMLEKLEIIESKLNEYFKILEEEMKNESLKDTIIKIWQEAASSAVDPKDRDELDKEPDARGGVETAKKMKRADEPAPNVSEALTAKQKKIDVDKDGEIEASDLAALRKKAKKEGVDEIQLVQQFKVSSMREALRKVWNIDEGELPPALKKAIDAKKKDKEEKDEDHDGDDEDEKREKTLTGKKRAAVDVNPDLVASRSH